jgi:coenzyme Q-binding protein COQ10
LDRKNLLIDVNFVHGPFKSLKNSWSFKELNNDTCEIDFFIDFELNIGVFNLLISRFFNQAFNKMVGSFEKRASQIYKSQ